MTTIFDIMVDDGDGFPHSLVQTSDGYAATEAEADASADELAGLLEIPRGDIVVVERCKGCMQPVDECLCEDDDEADEDEDEPDQGVDADGDCIACGHPADGSSGHGSCDAPCHTQSPPSEWYRPGKDNVSTWETVASYVDTFPSDDGEGACDVEVQVGEAAGSWFVRTTDDADGPDEWDDSAYDTRKEAVAAAEELADRLGEGEPGEDAEDYLARQLRETAGEPCTDGEWCVYWSTSLEDSGPRERYETEEAATAACEIANVDLHAAHPGGNLLCGFEVRRLVHGEWITEEMQDENVATLQDWEPEEDDPNNDGGLS